MKNINWLCLLLCLVFASCDRNKNNSDGNAFDRKPMLENYADKLIVPAFGQFQQKVNALQTATDSYVQQTDAPHLDALKTAWTDAVKAFQFCNNYNFGPAVSSTGTLTEDIATFPVDVVELEQFIANEDYSLNNFSRDTRGFFGIEYLIFDNDALSKFNNTDGNKRKLYLSAIVNDIKSRTDNVVSGWNTYRNTFVNATGTDAGSSASLLFNSFLIGFEFNKNFKLALPLGLRAGQTTSEPAKVEAYYSGISTELIELNFENTMQIYFGNDTEGVEGKGFDDYLKAVDGGTQLVDETTVQMNKVKTAIDNIPAGKLSDLIVSNPQPANTAHTEMQKLTRYIKSDMSSLLGISITYSSGDGD
jgi:predicted lipoprotein